MQKLILAALLLLTNLVQARELPDELVDEGVVVGQGQCQIPAVSQKKMDCYQVKMKGEMYVVLGVTRGNDFYVQFIGKLVNGQYIVVWSFKQVYV